MLLLVLASLAGCEAPEDLSGYDLSALIDRCEEGPDEVDGPLLSDVHVHSDSGATMGRRAVVAQLAYAEELLDAMNRGGVDRALVQANHLPDEHLGQALDLSRVWGEIGEVCPRLLPTVYGVDPSDLDEVERLEQLLDQGAFAAVGELELQHGSLGIRRDLGGEGGAALMSLLADRGLPLHLQAEPSEDPEVVAEVIALAERWPEVDIVWFSCSVEPALPNLWCDVYPDQLDDRPLLRSMLGSDLTPSTSLGGANAVEALSWVDHVSWAADAREALAGLPEELAEDLARGNFDAVWGEGG